MVGLDVCVLSGRVADYSSRGVLPTVIPRFMCSRNLKNVEAMARFGPKLDRWKNFLRSPLRAEQFFIKNGWLNLFEI